MAPNPNSASTPKDESALEEWKAVRDVLAKFDDRIADVRKIGFSLLTALLAAQSLLIPSFNSSGLPAPIKLTVILATLLLVVTVRVVERNYELFQKAAATRGIVLERKLNFELTENLSQRSRSDHFAILVTIVYVLFVLVAGIVGYFIILPDYRRSEIYPIGLSLHRTWFLAAIVVVSIAAVVMIGRISMSFRHYHRRKDVNQLQLMPVDWTLSKLECKRGNFVGITLTNLDDPKQAREICFKEGEVVCELRKENASPGQLSDAKFEIKADSEIKIGAQDSHTWFWDTGLLHKGKIPSVYKVITFERKEPTGRREKLNRSLQSLRGKKQPETEERILRRRITIYNE